MPTAKRPPKCHTPTLDAPKSALAAEDVATILGTTRAHALKLMTSQTIKSIRLGSHWSTSQDAVITYVGTLIDKAVAARSNETSHSKRKAKSRG